MSDDKGKVFYSSDLTGKIFTTNKIRENGSNGDFYEKSMKKEYSVAVVAIGIVKRKEQHLMCVDELRDLTVRGVGYLPIDELELLLGEDLVSDLTEIISDKLRGNIK